MDKLRGKQTNRVKKKKEPDPFDTKLRTTHKYNSDHIWYPSCSF